MRALIENTAQETLVTAVLRAGDRFRHFKGGEYEIVALATDEETLEPLVIYRDLKKDTVWARTLQNWNETVEIDGKEVKRFEKM